MSKRSCAHGFSVRHKIHFLYIRAARLAGGAARPLVSVPGRRGDRPWPRGRTARMTRCVSGLSAVTTRGLPSPRRAPRERIHPQSHADPGGPAQAGRGWLGEHRCRARHPRGGMGRCRRRGGRSGFASCSKHTPPSWRSWRGGDALVEQLEDSNRKMAAVYRRGRRGRRYDDPGHQPRLPSHSVAFAGSPRLRMILEPMIDMPVVIRSFYLYTPAELLQSLHHHEDIAIAAHLLDAELGRRAMQLHLKMSQAPRAEAPSGLATNHEGLRASPKLLGQWRDRSGRERRPSPHRDCERPAKRSRAVGSMARPRQPAYDRRRRQPCKTPFF